MLTKFGKWEIHQDFGLVGKINSGYDYNINKERLWEITEFRGQQVWSWMIHLAKKSWTSSENFNDLVTAFLFAQDLFNSEKPGGVENVSTAQSIFLSQQLVAIRESEDAESEDGIINLSLDSLIKYREKMDNIRLIEFT